METYIKPLREIASHCEKIIEEIESTSDQDKIIRHLQLILDILIGSEFPGYLGKEDPEISFYLSKFCGPTFIGSKPYRKEYEHLLEFQTKTFQWEWPQVRPIGEDDWEWYSRKFELTCYNSKQQETEGDIRLVDEDGSPTLTSLVILSNEDELRKCVSQLLFRDMRAWYKFSRFLSNRFYRDRTRAKKRQADASRRQKIIAGFSEDPDKSPDPTVPVDTAPSAESQDPKSEGPRPRLEVFDYGITIDGESFSFMGSTSIKQRLVDFFRELIRSKAPVSMKDFDVRSRDIPGQLKQIRDLLHQTKKGTGPYWIPLEYFEPLPGSPKTPYKKT